MTSFVLHLLRHGEPEGAGRMLGRSDAAPLALGIAACVERARGLGVEALIASDLARARCAGEAIGHDAGVSLRVDPRWRELDFGEWDGRLPIEAGNEALGAFWDDPDANPPPGGERWSALVERVSEAIGELAAVPTLVVAHGGAMRAALAALCGFDCRQTWAMDLPYASLLSLRVWPGDVPSAQIIGLRA